MYSRELRNIRTGINQLQKNWTMDELEVQSIILRIIVRYGLRI